MLLADGTLLRNSYSIVRLIGQGGMGAVYEARHKTLRHRVALKQLLDNNNKQLLEEAFEHEGRLLVHLQHPALPNVSDFFVEKNSPFLVMEYISGDDLAEKLKQQKHPFRVEQVLDWADQLLDVLEYLHGQPVPIIHHDIKPANIKLSPQGKIILLDFGISKGGQIHTGYLQPNSINKVIGFTPPYASAEQMKGQGTDERSDLHSLGVTLYELLTKQKPISGLDRLHDDDPLSFDNLKENHPELPVGVLEVLACAMALDPNERPSNAKQMRQMLQRVSRSHAQATLVPTEPLTDVSDDRKFSGRSLWRSRPAVLAMGAVLVLLIAVFNLISQSQRCNELDIDSFIINNNVKVELGQPYTVTPTDTTEGLLIKANLDIGPLGCQEDLSFEWAVLDHENRVILVQNSTDKVSIEASLVGNSKTIEVSVKEMTTAQQAIRSLILKR